MLQIHYAARRSVRVGVYTCRILDGLWGHWFGRRRSWNRPGGEGGEKPWGEASEMKERQSRWGRSVGRPGQEKTIAGDRWKNRRSIGAKDGARVGNVSLIPTCCIRLHRFSSSCFGLVSTPSCSLVSTRDSDLVGPSSHAGSRTWRSFNQSPFLAWCSSNWGNVCFHFEGMSVDKDGSASVHYLCLLLPHLAALPASSTHLSLSVWRTFTCSHFSFLYYFYLFCLKKGYSLNFSLAERAA